MSEHTRTLCCLVAALGVGLSAQALAWTPYGYGPYGPGYQGDYPEVQPPEQPPGTTALEPDFPPPPYPPGDHPGQAGYPYGVETPEAAYGYAPPGHPPPAPTYPGYGPQPGPSWAYPGAGARGFGRPPGFRISRTTSNDAYLLTVDLDGMGPEEVQIRTQGQSIVISRAHSAQELQKDSFDDGRGFVRSFSYSSGTSSRRLSVPRDADLSAMSREDGEGRIQIRIPRQGR